MVRTDINEDMSIFPTNVYSAIAGGNEARQGDDRPRRPLPEQILSTSSEQQSQSRETREMRRSPNVLPTENGTTPGPEGGASGAANANGSSDVAGYNKNNYKYNNSPPLPKRKSGTSSAAAAGGGEQVQVTGRSHSVVGLSTAPTSGRSIFNRPRPLGSGNSTSASGGQQPFNVQPGGPALDPSDDLRIGASDASVSRSSPPVAFQPTERAWPQAQEPPALAGESTTGYGYQSGTVRPTNKQGQPAPAAASVPESRETMEKKFLEKLREDSKWNCGHTRNSSEEYSSWNPAYFLPATLKLTTTTLGTTGIALAYAWGNVQKAITGDKLSEQTTMKAALTAWLKMNGIMSTVSWPRGESEKDLMNSPFLVCNHISQVDGMIMANELDNPRVMAKAEIRKLPMIGDYMEDMGTVWVERGSADGREAARRAIEGHVAQWRPGKKAMLVFPEGSTTSGNTVAEFKLGAFRPGVPVRPIILLYFGSSDISCPLYKHNSKGQVTEFDDREWFGNWLGAGFVSALIKVCRVHYPTEEEKLDPAVYAANVQRYMKYEYDRLKRKHAEYTRKRKKEMETYGLGWTVQGSPELEMENAVVQDHEFRPYTDAELRAAKTAILERRAKAKEEMMSRHQRQGVADEDAARAVGAVRSGSTHGKLPVGANGNYSPGAPSTTANPASSRGRPEAPEAGQQLFSSSSNIGGDPSSMSIQSQLRSGIDPGSRSKSRKGANGSSLGAGSGAASSSRGNKNSPTSHLSFPNRKHLPATPNPATTQLHHTGGISDVEILPDVTSLSRSAAPANRSGAHSSKDSFSTPFSPREASEVGGGRSAPATYQLDMPYVDSQDDEDDLEVFAEMERKDEGALEKITDDEILENELQ
eukprot:CAMPEP_0179006724 /NCGR_PEP_ID=MMETSP0795-20121207/14724_1 /TAXON_ID=88552 /ORGANISM="Amoebophrya sp., Strain Ameob2" /LENGTH=869 /DNA_ID=CAMNT_0020701539 /DNA_START=239 /DNA_END=2845 /DNA_ORIENTATION=-